ncbi:MAG: type I restriction enzyme HsdR N-terminal domain-containing protein [Helicobacteraceae bacterium]|jgi:hypothetical protein|nr:type I restriction enzyme HsdR N-terminal domain-containing protein [Helicobacteraceae bacterium]
MQAFIECVRAHAEHIARVGDLCDNEETTKQAAIVPLLNILGFSSIDPTKTRAEFRAEFAGAKANERVDYALFQGGKPVMFVEAKAWNEPLTNHAPQLARYFNAISDVNFAAITNGREWRFFTDMNQKNIMDSKPFLTIDFTGDLDDWTIARLYNFRYDNFQPDALKSLAVDSALLNSFTNIVNDLLREPDLEFARFVASRANLGRSLTTKFLESAVPQLDEAIKRAIGAIAITGLNAAPIAKSDAPAIAIAPNADDEGDIVDPSNPKIITTYAERRLFETVKDILGDDADIVGKDTESYYGVLFQGKTTRWILHYYGDKKNPKIDFCVPLTDERKREVKRAGLKLGAGESVVLDKPKDLLRIAGIVLDAYDYVQNDENFRRMKKE